MRRTSAFISVFALMLSMLALPASAETYTEDWDGRGSDSERCFELQEGDPRGSVDGDGWIHWVFATKGASTTAALTVRLDGVEIDGSPFAPGPPLNAEVWHFYTPFPAELVDAEGDAVGDWAERLTATIELNGAPGRGGGLVISDFCPGDGDEPFVPDGVLNVEKTVETSYDREHFWDIDKRVETEEGHELNDLPKVWLYTDGSGDETATWTVDVTYEGFEDSDIVVEGTIDISIGGNMNALIESLDDVISQGEGEDAVETTAAVDCGEITFPHLMLVGDPDIECTYSADVDSITDGTNTATATGEFIPPVEVDEDEDLTIDESDTKDVIFGDPDNETNATVGVSDTPFGESEVFLGTVTAPNDGEFTYGRDFAFDDFANCGNYRYDNTAMIEETGQTASASLLVNVQCLVFDGDTVTGAGARWSAIARAPNNWFEYSPFAGNGGSTVGNRNNGFDNVRTAGSTVNLIQGAPRNLVGTASVGATNGATTLCFDLDELVLDPDAASNVKIQPLTAKPTSYIQPGRFSHHFDREGGSFCVNVPSANYGYAIHLDAGQFVPDPDFGP